MTVQALIQAAGRGTRLGLGPKAFVTLDGRTLLERAIDLVSDVAGSIIVAVPEDGMMRAQALVRSDKVTFIAGGASRSETTRRLIFAATSNWLLLHDVVHPFASRELAGDLLRAARETGASAPGIPNTEFMYSPKGDRLHSPGDVIIGQKPVVVSRKVIQSAYGMIGERLPAQDDPSLMELLESAGQRTQFVRGSARNIKITGPDDLAFAEAMLSLEKVRRAAG